MGKTLYGRPAPRVPAPPKAPNVSVDGMSKGSAYAMHKPPTPTVKPNTAILPLKVAAVPHNNYDHACEPATGSKCGGVMRGRDTDRDGD